jgi:hypothetical protein
MLYIDKVPQHVRLEVLDAAAALEAKAKDAPTAQAPPSPGSSASLPEKLKDEDRCVYVQDGLVCGHPAICHEPHWKHKFSYRPKPWESDRIPHERSEYGWRAREAGDEFKRLVYPAVEIHPRAVRVRMHKHNPECCAYWFQCEDEGCTYAHADFLQVSSEVK